MSSIPKSFRCSQGEGTQISSGAPARPAPKREQPLQGTTEPRNRGITDPKSQLGAGRALENHLVARPGSDAFQETGLVRAGNLQGRGREVQHSRCFCEGHSLGQCSEFIKHPGTPNQREERPSQSPARVTGKGQRSCPCCSLGTKKILAEKEP